jgi:hypothetical protein
MKKQILILWTGAFIIAFLAAYFSTVTDRDFPLSGTIGIGGRQLTYRFEKKVRTSDSLAVVLRNDADSVSAYMDVYAKDTVRVFFKPSDNGRTLRAAYMIANIPATLQYAVFVKQKESVFQLPPDGSTMKTLCVGKVPAQIMQVYYLTLFLGLLLAVRTAMEYFTEGKKIKKLALFTTISFNLFGFFVVPVMRAFELNIIDKSIVQPTELFGVNALVPGLSWIGITVFLFSSKKEKPAALFAGIITILLIIGLHF